MSSVKITINSEDRVVIIPMEYDKEKDSLSLREIQIEPVPDDKEDISKDVVMLLSQHIINLLNGLA